MFWEWESSPFLFSGFGFIRPAWFQRLNLILRWRTAGFWLWEAVALFAMASPAYVSGKRWLLQYRSRRHRLIFGSVLLRPTASRSEAPMILLPSWWFLHLQAYLHHQRCHFFTCKIIEVVRSIVGGWCLSRFVDPPDSTCRFEPFEDWFLLWLDFVGGGAPSRLLSGSGGRKRLLVLTSVHWSPGDRPRGRWRASACFLDGFPSCGLKATSCLYWACPLGLFPVYVGLLFSPLVFFCVGQCWALPRLGLVH